MQDAELLGLFPLIPFFLAVTALHPGPSIWGDFRLSDQEVVLVVEGAADPLTTNLRAPYLLLGPRTDAERRVCEAELERTFRERFPVELDGDRVIPTLRELVIQDGAVEDASWRSARIVLVYPCERRPRRLSIRWDDFEGEGVDFIPITIQEVGGGPEMFSLWPDHPEWTWHAGDVIPPRTPVAVVVPSAARSVAVPVPSVAMGLAGMLALLATWRRRRGVGLVVAAALLAGAGLARDVGRVDLELGWGGRATLPAPSQARAIFESLHGNVYAAFAAESEDAIYDLLAASVAPERLDEMYGDVYESLLLRQEGGAVCSIAAVETIEGAVDESSYEVGGAPEFFVDWSWRVKGIVSHWGHVHRRVNRYRARYTVRHDGVGWKIADVVVQEFERVDE